MSETQQNQILELLETGRWVCTSDMYRLYMADPRRRLCDLKDKGYKLESRRCEQHDYHKGGSKEWRLTDTSKAEPKLLRMTNRIRDWNKTFATVEPININQPLW